MTSTSSFKAAVAGFAFVLVITLALPAEGAWPRLLMVYGAALTRPLVVEEPKDIVKVFDGKGEAVDRNDLDRRLYFELALFWGDTWNRYMNEGRPAGALKPEDVTPFDNIPIRGRLYPACGVHPAQITLTKVNSQEIRDIWRLSPDGLKVLEKLGVPIKSDCN
jgi:hypothetical protein